MTSYVPPKKNDSNGYVFYVSLAPRTADGTWQANPTLAAGDVKIAIDDGAPANLTTLPAVDADYTKRVKVTLSQAETNGDNLTIIFSDAAGAEWCDLTVNLQTAAQTFDDLKTTTDAILLDTAEIGAAGAGLTAIPWNAAWDAEVQSEVTDALNAYDPPTNTEMTAAFTEIKGATWATTDTLEAIRDRGDAAWTTATGFSTHSAADVWSVATRVLTANTNLNDLDAAGVRAAVGLASADLDTQLDDLPAIKSKTDSLTFTVAGQVDANIQYVNDVAVTGTGASGDEWGP